MTVGRSSIGRCTTFLSFLKNETLEWLYRKWQVKIVSHQLHDILENYVPFWSPYFDNWWITADPEKNRPDN